MPEQSWLGPGNKSEALGRRPGEAGHVPSPHVPSPQLNSLWPLAASSVLPPAPGRGERVGFLLAEQGLLGREGRACQLLSEAGGLGYRCNCPLGAWGPFSPPTTTSDSQEGESCQVTCRGQHEPEAPASALTWEAGRVLVDRG